jgi:hypothetical protein
MQRRLQALAAERGIPPADYAKLMWKRVSTGAFMAFCEKHNVSTDWLLSGDLKGLQRMTTWAKAEPQSARSVGHFMEMYNRLRPEVQKAIEATVDRLLDVSQKRPTDIEALQREIQRLKEAKRRALPLADERAKENVALRAEIERLRARIAECNRS